MKTEIEFKINEFCIYKTHGVGKIKEIKKMNLAGQEYKCLVVYFAKEKMTLSIPFSQVSNGYLRKIVDEEKMEEAFEILRNGIKKVKGMWSRRAKEYEEKIDSGDVLLIAEVLRDLTRDIDDAERSYSERVIYETALHRLASEYSIIKNVDYSKAEETILEIAKEKIKFSEIKDQKKA